MLRPKAMRNVMLSRTGCYAISPPVSAESALIPASPRPASPLPVLARGWLRRHGVIDRLAIALSGLCLVHCVATALVLASVASLGGLFHAHWVHEVGLVLAIALALVALVRGLMTHGFVMPLAVGGFGLAMMGAALALPHGGDELLATMIGVLFVALGHDLNQRAAR